MQPTWDLVKALRDKGFAAAISGAGSCAAVFYEEKSQASEEENNAANISKKTVAAEIEKIAKPLLVGCDWKILHVHVDSIGVAITRE